MLKNQKRTNKLRIEYDSKIFAFPENFEHIKMHIKIFLLFICRSHVGLFVRHGLQLTRLLCSLLSPEFAKIPVH